MKATDSAKRAVLYKAVDYLFENPEERFPKVMNIIDSYAPDTLFPEQRRAFRNAINDRSNWYELLLRLAHCNPKVIKRLVKTVLVDANLLAWPVQEANRDKYECNIPWAILLDPTSACNLHCTGCWAAEYGHKQNLSFEDIDSIIEQGKELGCHIYIYTGGEPMVRKHDLIRLCEKHQDCAFLCFTNATLIDEAFCLEMERVANFVPAISAEGTEATTDARRGKGTYAKIDRAMDLLKAHGLPFGISACWTSANAEAIATEEYMDWMIDKGALFCWFFIFMPVGADSTSELMPTADQRVNMYNFIRDMRTKKALFTLDFQNDGEFVGGCIAGGRRYLHINAAGDVEPCVFIHYSNANIHEVSLLEALKSPLFMKYYEGQPFNDNYLKPCPMLENPDVLPEMVAASGAHSTDLVKPESPEELREKCVERAAEWAPVAERIWNDPNDPMHERRIRSSQGMAIADNHKFERLGYRGYKEHKVLLAEEAGTDAAAANETAAEPESVSA